MLTVASLCDASYVGRLFVKASGKPIEILGKLNELAGFAPDEEIELFEVNSHFSLCSIKFLQVPKYC